MITKDSQEIRFVSDNDHAGFCWQGMRKRSVPPSSGEILSRQMNCGWYTLHDGTGESGLWNLHLGIRFLSQRYVRDEMKLYLARIKMCLLMNWKVDHINFMSIPDIKDEMLLKAKNTLLFYSGSMCKCTRTGG